jgi:hypothetical protein
VSLQVTTLNEQTDQGDDDISIDDPIVIGILGILGSLIVMFLLLLTLKYKTHGLPVGSSNEAGTVVGSSNAAGTVVGSSTISDPLVDSSKQPLLAN